MGTKENFRANLPYYMKRAGMNQIDLAKAIGKSEASVSLWIAGKAFPRIDTIQKIADVVGCRTDDLIVEREPVMSFAIPAIPFHPSVAEKLERSFAGAISGREKQLLSLFATMTDSDKEKLLDYAQYIVDSYTRPDKRRPK